MGRVTQKYTQPSQKQRMPNQSAKPRSQSRTFILHTESQGSAECECDQQRLRPECAGAQADLSSCWSHIDEDAISLVTGYIPA